MANAAKQEDLLFQIVRRATLEPDWFCTDILKCPNDIWQSEMMNAVADLDRVRLNVPTIYNHDDLNRFTVRAFHGPGKTHMLAKLMHWFNFTRKGRIIVTAPKEDQVKTRVWPEFRKLLGGADPDYKKLVQVYRTTITWLSDDDWVALIESASRPENLAGHHDEHIMYLVEEASGVEEEMFPAIEGALSTPGSCLVLIGNPTRTQGEFYNSHMKPGTRELYYRKAIQHHETPRITQRWVDGMIAKYGKDSPVVQVRVFGNFVDTEENQLLALEWLQQALDREFKEDGSIPKFRVSVDVADGGEDFTVVSTMIIYQSFRYLKKQRKYSFKSSVSPIEAAKAAARIYNSLAEEYPGSEGDLVVDSIGVGAGTAGWLMDKGYPVIAYKGGASSDDSLQWRNRRTQSYLSYRNDYRDGKIVIASDYCEADEWDDFFAQHTSIKTKPGTERVEDLETKQEMQNRGIKSPDMADAPAMHYCTESPSMGKINLDIITQIESEAPYCAWNV